MIERVHLENFKCFADVEILLGRLTLLTGINGTGKSTVIQSLALLRQSVSGRSGDISGLVLNGGLALLGTATDVLHEFAEDDEVRIGFCEDGEWRRWAFSARESDEDVLPSVPDASPPAEGLLFKEGLLHLAAERIGPRTLHPMSAHVVRTEDSMLSDGSFAVAWLEENQRLEVLPALRHPDAPASTLREQVQQWMGEVSPGLQLTVSAHKELQRAEIRFGFVAESAKSRGYRPTGVGFGLSYTLPIVLACLASRPGRLLLLENPEAHLHPKGQMAMGTLIAMAAKAGGQVLVETHSDHVLNGVRLAVKEGALLPDDVAIHFFRREVEGFAIRHTCVSPQLDADGRLDQWPEGFFDQFDIALEKLL